MKEIFDVFCLIPVAELRPMNGSFREHGKRKHSGIGRDAQRWNELLPARLSPQRHSRISGTALTGGISRSKTLVRLDQMISEGLSQPVLICSGTLERISAFPGTGLISYLYLEMM